MCHHVVKGSDLACSSRLHDRPYAEWCKPCLIGEIGQLEAALIEANVRLIGSPVFIDEPPQLDDSVDMIDPEEWEAICLAIRSEPTPTFMEAS